jgi:hypothetical protein
MKAVHKLALIFSILASGCSLQQPLAEVSSAPPTLTPVIVALAPQAKPVELALRACAELLPGTAVHLESDLMRGAPLRIQLTEGENPPPYLYLLAQDELVVIVNPANPAIIPDLPALRAVYQGDVGRWEELGGQIGPIKLWAYPTGDILAQVFDAAYNLEGSLPSQAYLAPGPEQMLSAVAADQDAIGFIPRSWINDQVRAVEIDQDALAIELPVLVLAEERPSGPSLALIECLQSGAGQQILEEVYRQ